ncbi:MAG: signal peptidase I [Propionibacteriales bacterium]|nr:signal peptidase I [Propionibacteriales bacterium]
MTTEEPDDTAAEPNTGSDAAVGGAGSTPKSHRGEVKAKTRTKPNADERKHLPVWQESILLLAVALGLAVLIKALFVQAFYIPSESMEPGLVKNDRILVQKVSYWFGKQPQRGDVVVFEDPGEWLGPSDTAGPTGMANLLSKIGLYPTGGHLVKRVIGTAGDVVVCCDEDGQISVNGQVIDESSYLGPDPGACNAVIEEFYTEAKTALGRPCGWTIGPIPDGKLLVLGDNRGHSADSRAHLCGRDEDPCTQSPWVDTDLVVGKVFTLIWPRDRWRWISRPEVFDDVPDDPPAEVLERAEKLAD